jgi:hypothetical protein
MSDSSELIHCERHGETPTTFACHHVALGIACGYHASGDDPNDQWPDAWCDLCHHAFRSAGEQWTQTSESAASIKAMCTHCYEEARDRNADVPAFARGATTKLTAGEIEALFEHAVSEQQDVQAASDQHWGWRSLDHWDFDQAERSLTFSSDEGPQVVATVELVGSYSTTSRTFQWAWQTFPEGAPQTREIARLRVFGDVRGISQLATPKWSCDEGDAWEMASLAGYILGSEGLYRAPFEDQLWFMLLSEWRRPSE